MSEGIVAQQRERTGKTCRHRWIIETPHGATSRGVCKRCGATRRFPNAADDALAESAGARLGHWSGRRSVSRPAEISLADSLDYDEG